MTMGISPESIDEMSIDEINVYSRLLPLYFEFLDTRMENCIKRALGELFGG